MSEKYASPLTFPDIPCGTYQVPRDLMLWAYRGGATCHPKIATQMIESGGLGVPLSERMELLGKIHDVLLNQIGRGGRKSTVIADIQRMAMLFRWADDTGYGLTLESAEDAYRDWTDWMIHRVRIKKDLQYSTAYGYGSAVGRLMDRVLERISPVIRTTRLRHPKAIKQTIAIETEKASLEDTFAFGKLMLDIADGLAADVIWGPLPVVIKIRDGKHLIDWGGVSRNPRKAESKNRIKLNLRSELKRINWENSKTFRTRFGLINLRIQVEMLMLMGQPGINLAQVHKLRMDQWRFQPSINGYEVRAYKHRKSGPVVFEIYSEYRPIFERYLRWRSEIFPDDPDGLLFPLLGRWGSPVVRSMDKPPIFGKVQRACEAVEIKYISPRALRSANVNWFLRRTQNPELTAELKQHSVRTLISSYQKPSLQKAMVQIHAFWIKHDPALVAAGPGACIGNGSPKTFLDELETTPVDCRTPSGCFHCENHRDIDTFDYVWSLASFRLLKSFELKVNTRNSQVEKQNVEPAMQIVRKISEKLAFIEKTTSQRGEWVREALLRIDEGRYHPDWSMSIEAV